MQPAYTPPAISIHELAAILGHRDAPMIFDVCLPEDHALDPRLIPGALQMSHHDAVADESIDASAPVVIVCQKGLKLSQGVTALLRAEGRFVQYLEGGMQAWSAADLPLWPMTGGLPLGQTGLHWAIGTPLTALQLFDAWTVARFVDPRARFALIAADQAEAMSERFATPNVSLSHYVRAVAGALHAPFKVISTSIATPEISTMLEGYCTAHPPVERTVRESFAMFDGLWATSHTCGGVSAP